MEDNLVRDLPGLGLGDHNISSFTSSISAKFGKKPRHTIWLWNKMDRAGLYKNPAIFRDKCLAAHSIRVPVDKLWNCIKNNIACLMEDVIPSKLTSSQFRQAWLIKTPSNYAGKRDVGSKKLNNIHTQRRYWISTMMSKENVKKFAVIHELIL